MLTPDQPRAGPRVFAWDARGRLLSQNSRRRESPATATRPPANWPAPALPRRLSGRATRYDAAQRLIGAQRQPRREHQLHARTPRATASARKSRTQTGAIALVTGRIINSLNQVAAIQGCGGQTTQLAYDANGEPISADRSAEPDHPPDPGRPAPPHRHHLPGQHLRHPGLEPAGPAHPVTDPKGVATSYQTNAFGEVMSETSPDIGTIKYTRDAARRRHGIEDAKGQISAHRARRPGPAHRDPLCERPCGLLQYDAGRRLSAASKTSPAARRYERDAQGRITAKTQAVNDNPSNPSQLQGRATATAHGHLTSIDLPQRPEGLLPAHGRPHHRHRRAGARPAPSKTPAVRPVRERPHAHGAGPAQGLELGQWRQRQPDASTPTGA